MNKILFFVLASLFLVAPAADAYYTIDGNVSDWGINLDNAASEGYLDINKPSGGNDIDFITEDNTDKYSMSEFIGPGYSGWGNNYDAETIYFDNDADYAYLAIITGVSKTDNSYPPGDIFFQVGPGNDPFGSTYSPNSKSFAIDVYSSNLYSVNIWDPTVFESHEVTNPWRLGRESDGYWEQVDPSNTALLNLGNNFIYTNDPTSTSHYVMEAKIPLSTLGLSTTGVGDSDLWIHWTMKCGNDYLNLKGDVNGANAVPEPASMFLLSSGLLGLFGYRRKKLS